MMCCYRDEQQDNFVVIDDSDNTYVGLYGVYCLINGLQQRVLRLFREVGK